MYAAIWKILPGPLWLRIVMAAALVIAVLTVLVLWVFPFVDHLMIPQEVTVGS
jgi:hypothetical protein